MTEGRSTPDKNIGRDLPDKIQDKNFDRSSEFQWHVESSKEEVKKDSEWLARLSVLTYGAHVFRASKGGNLFAEAMHYAGRGAQYIAGMSGRKQPLFVRETGDLLRKAIGLPGSGGGSEAILRGSAVRVGEFDLIKDLSETLTFMYKAGSASVQDELAERFAKHFKNLPRGASRKKPGFFDSGLQPVTVGDFLENGEEFFKVVNNNSFATKTAQGSTVPLEIGILKKARSLGFISDDTIFDPNLLKTVKKGKDGSRIAQLLDTRMRNPFFAASAISKSFNPFGLSSVISSFFSSTRKIAELGAEKGSNFNRILIGSDVYKVSHSSIQHVKTGQKLGLAGSARHEAALLREAQISGKLSSLYEDSTVNVSPGVGPKFHERKGGFFQKLSSAYEDYTTDASLLDKLQNATGVGPKFHEQRGGFFQRLFSAVRQAKAVGSEKAQFFAVEHKSTGKGAKAALGMIDPELAGDISYSAGSGKVIEKGKFAGTGAGYSSGVLSKEQALKLPYIDRLKAYFGISDDLRIIKSTSSANVELNKSDLYLKHGRGGIPSLQSKIRTRSGAEPPTGTTLMGGLDRIERSEFFATSDARVDSLYDFANYMTIRMNKLMSSSLFGIGFRPSGNILANTARLAAIPALYYSGFEAIKYGNYAAGEILGKSPVEAAADLYTTARVKQQEFRGVPGTGVVAGGIAGALLGGKLGATGRIAGATIGGLLGFSGPGGSISSGTDFIEEALLPGTSVGAVGGIGAGITGFNSLQKFGSVGKALKTAGLLYGLIGGPNVSQDPEQLKRIYSGEEKVPIRKARGWMMGYQPFKGGQISHFAPSWNVKLKQSPYVSNIYGSEKNYWKYGSILPTPSNLFGLRILAEPYKVEKANYYDRPYPITAGLFEEIPIFGPLVSDTVGSIIKPRKKMHSAAQSHIVAANNIKNREVPKDVASRLGIPSIPGSLVDINRPDILADRLSKYANVGLEPTGIWKFALEVFGVKFDDDYKMASADNMTSISRMFYDASLGGALGDTEAMRRFLLSDYGLPSKINEQINPIANTMPRWLPGSLSEMHADKDYFYDFTRGDAYSKIPGGEYRLPGVGYEKTNRLHSNSPGQYDEVDKFLILSDVAPYSTAYQAASAKVANMNLTPYWQQKVEQAHGYREEKSKPFDFFEPGKQAKEYYTSLAENNQSANAPAAPTALIRNLWTTAATEGLSELPIIGSKFFPYRTPVEHYRKFAIEGETFADWTHPGETVLRPALYDVMGQDPFTGALKGAMLGAVASGWGPFSAFKFLNPTQAMVQNELSSMAIGAALGGTVSTARMITTGKLQGGYIPPHVETEREVEEYFDHLKYAKYRSLEITALEKNNEELASKFAAEARRTNVFGLEKFKNTGDITSYARTLKKRDRAYFESFLMVPEDSRQEALGLVPDHMRNVLETVYEGGLTSSGKSVMAYRASDEQTLKYFRDHAMPEDNWIGWHPDISDTAVRIKAIEGGINGVSDNIHRFGFYPNQAKEVNMRFPFLSHDDFSLSINRRTMPGVKLWMDSMFKDKGENPFSQFDFSRTESNFGPAHNSFNFELQDSGRDDLMLFLNDIYR